jgi:hypothetical protein
LRLWCPISGLWNDVPFFCCLLPYGKQQGKKREKNAEKTAQ